MHVALLSGQHYALSPNIAPSLERWCLSPTKPVLGARACRRLALEAKRLLVADKLIEKAAGLLVAD